MQRADIYFYEKQSLELRLHDGVDVDTCRKQDEEGEGDGDEDLPPLEEEGADEGSRMEEVD